jgi:hypothetical protein
MVVEPYMVAEMTLATLVRIFGVLNADAERCSFASAWQLSSPRIAQMANAMMQ